MGLLPCLLRSSTAYLIEIDQNHGAVMVSSSSSTSNNVNTNVNSNSNNTKDEKDKKDDDSSQERLERLLWIEQIFLLTSALINICTSNVLPALTENGLMNSLINVLKYPQRRDDSSDRQRAVVDSLLTMILDASISSLPAATTIFVEQKGPEACLQRILWELESLERVKNGHKIRGMSISESENIGGASVTAEILEQGDETIGEVPHMSKVLIQQLFMVFNTFLSERGNSAVTDHHRSELVKSEIMGKILALMFTNAVALGANVLHLAVYLIVDSINNDPAQPGILSHFISTGIAKACLKLVSPNKHGNMIKFNSTLFLAVGNTISAFMLTEDGTLMFRVMILHYLGGIFFNVEWCIRKP